MSKELTKEEVQEKIFAYLDNMIDFWITEKTHPSVREKMEGLIFSVLVMIDGESAMLPPYKLEPSISLPDGEEWIDSGIDIAGGLHDSWYKKNKEELDG